MHKIIEDLNWRYATKKFDPSKKLTDEQVSILKESIRLSASSYGLQAFKVLQVDNPELREKLMVASYGQRPVVDASHLFVFCAHTEVADTDVQNYMELISETQGIPEEELTPFANGIMTSMKKKTDHEILNWTARQTYIALGQLLHTCASLRVDALPMEGFDPTSFDEILNLSASNLTATLACPVGYRHEEDIAQFRKKVRKSSDDLFETR